MRIINLTQVITVFSLGFLSLYFVYFVLTNFLKQRLDIGENNTSYAMLSASILIATSLFMVSVMNAGVSAIQFLNQADNLSLETLLISSGYVVAFAVIGLIFTFLVLSIGLFIFFRLTATNEIEQLKLNNISIAIISSAFILGLAIIMHEQIGHLCETLIPYPKIIQIR